jgi:hypothetical protein
VARLAQHEQGQREQALPESAASFTF